ncbi:hypothetical protein Phou_063960 [Phytohabitans houttuyneae]|uniref:Orc1-like AAA ATPase domain-containing protein n=1 Tax=Phytohabitans houttuyneae TaxID=1076126 RepID=A0A6V8KJQ5_9ACTN|nr:ATP-binding protein [Phytohabitans houttuyneae]GFJ82216.1 hypothetical protein Phou_063960 [Phytohabitans houttuyneae]
MSDEAPLFFSLPIGAYRDTRWTRLDTDAEVGRIAELLAPFGFAHDPWPAAVEERGEDGVNIRLSDWNHRWRGRATIFYWVGHGFRDSERALLAHYFTVHHDDERDMHGVLPLKLSEVLRGRYGDEHPPPWTVMIIDACSSAAFVRELATHVTATRDATPTQLLLLGTSGDGETRLGEVSRHLAQTLSTHFARNDRIPVAGLIGQMVADGLYAANVISFGTLSGADLVRRQATAPVTAPLDLLADVEREINALGELERAHFVRPLHGGEAGDLSWYFTGRDAEQRRIAGWLRDNDHGLLAVAGHAGVGKSAILGHVLVQSRPPMRTVLARLGFDLTADEEQLPGDGVFTSTLLLTGFDRHSLAAALAEVGGLARPPLYNDPGRLARWLTDRLPPLTLLADALDQAREPEIVAGMLAQIARRGGIRVLVGTRRSAEILEELGEHPVLSVEYDESTVVEYVQDRLFRAFPDLAGPAALATARLVARRGRDFLFARLAVGELLERPGLLEDREALDGLLARGRSGIFADWLDRAGGQAPAIPRLLLALAYMRGRGLPSADGVWATVAGALTTGPPLTTADIAEAVQRRAAGFLVADVENGTTVYRLAHTVYEDVLRERHGAGEESAHLAIVRALLQATGGDGALAPYSRAYLSAHAAAAGRLGWNALAERPRVLDRLDGVRLRTDLIRDALGHNDLPPEIVGAVGAGHLIATADPADRRGIREVAMARYAGTSRFGRNVDGDTWSVRSAWLAGETAHLTVGKAGGGMVNALTTFLGPRGTLLASAGDEGSVRLIDPVTGQQVDRLSQPGVRCGPSRRPWQAAGTCSRRAATAASSASGTPSATGPRQAHWPATQAGSVPLPPSPRKAGGCSPPAATTRRCGSGTWTSTSRWRPARAMTIG